MIVLVAWLLLAPGPRAVAQQPVVAPPPPSPEMFSRSDFHLTAAALRSPQVPGTNGQLIDDPRFSWDTHWGGSLDVVDYVRGRLGVIIDYQAVLGSEFRPFDPYQGNYTLEVSGSARLGDDTEIAGIFHHVSRHLGDRPKRIPVAWNELGARVLHRVALGPTTVDIDVEGGRAIEHAYVDYTWLSEAHVLVRHAMSPRVGLFAHGMGQLVTVDGTVPNRGRQSGGLVEAGIRVNTRGGIVELFGGLEKRMDADPLDRQPQHWALAGFRLLSR